MINLLLNHCDSVIAIVIGFYFAAVNFFPATYDAANVPEPDVILKRERSRSWMLKGGLVVLAIGIFRFAMASPISLPGSRNLESSGGYSVTFPGKVREESVEQSGILFHRARYRDNDRDIEFESAYIDKRPLEYFSAQNMVQILGRKFGNPVERRIVEIDGLRGDESVFKIGNTHTVSVRIFVGEQRVCYFMRAVPNALQGDPEVLNFFSSIHFNRG